MKYKLINVRDEIEYNVEYGTCEHCFATGDLEYKVAVVEDSNGVIHEFENGEWCWGDYQYYTYYGVKNIIDFADWFSKKEFSNPLNASSFWHLMDEYNDELAES